MSFKIKYILFSFTLLLTGLHPCINIQAQPASYSYMEELFDGYYATVYVDIQSSNARSSTKTASKTYKLSSSSGEVIATYKLTASFSYPYNNTAKCTSASYNTTVNNSNWSFSNCSSSKSGNQATGKFTINHKILGITIDTFEKTLTISCDKNVNIS